MVCCPSSVNKCPFNKTYYFVFGKEFLVFGNIIYCLFRMYCVAPYTVTLSPISSLFEVSVNYYVIYRKLYRVNTLRNIVYGTVHNKVLITMYITLCRTVYISICIIL